MKQVIKPAEREEATYFTDFKGHSCGEFSSPVELRLTFNYGSKYDGDSIELDLDDDESKLILDVIKQNMSVDYKKQLLQKYKAVQNNYECSVQCRDWMDCETTIKSLSLLEYMLDYTNDNEQ